MAVIHIASSHIPTDRSAIHTESFTTTVSRVEVPHRGPRGWHHHGDHHVVAYLISRKVRIESGPGGGIITEPSAGDLVHERRFVTEATSCRRELRVLPP